MEEEQMQQRRFLTVLAVGALVVSACSGGGSPSPAGPGAASPGASTPAVSGPPASAPAPSASGPALPTAVGAGEGELTVLAWPGYAENGSTDPAYNWVTPFETQTGCKTSVQVFGTSDEAFSLFTTNPDKFDVISASGDASLRLVRAGYVQPVNVDLTRQHASAPLGERIIVEGRVLDENGRPVPRTLVEIWQANACGRYAHEVDRHDAPLDPNFTGTGRAITDEEGRYRFVTIKPGHYPWGNHYNAWRPAHIHFSVLGPGFLTRLVTQMYFPGDPLFPLDPIFNSVRDPAVRERMVSSFDIGLTVPDWALGFRWDIVLRGREATPMLA